VRLLFVSGTTVGGSGRSQRELAARLASRGHDVRFVVDAGQPARGRRWLYEQLSDLSARLAGRWIRRLVLPLEGLPGRRAHTSEIGGIDHFTTPVPENAFRRIAEEFQPDVVLGSSVLRLTWRKVLAACDSHDIATVLYVREVAAMNHFDTERDPADVIVANATSLVEQVRGLGHRCTLVPSIIETSVTSVDSAREVALLVNPIRSHGVELAAELARRLPDIPFVLQESWPLPADERRWLETLVATCPNVALRPAGPAGPDLYAQARVLLVPHRLDNRPRVVAEAQANGIPVIASRFPGLEEAVGPGGVLVGMDDADAWRESLRRLWDEPIAYADLVTRARAHSQRSEIDPELVTDALESILGRALAARQRHHVQR
jgi:glycosyltransferase involved in cell wall biosynthesis